MATLTTDDELSSFDVPETSRHPSGHTIYKIVLQVTPKDITKNTYQIIYWKRYTDIRKLYEILHRYHLAIYRPGKFPDFPEKSRFMERFNPVVVEERRVATKEFLNYCLQHLYLRTHDAYLNFFQKGEKVFLPDVQTKTLQPEPIHPHSSSPVIERATATADVPNIPEVPERKTEDDLLLTIDEQEHIEDVSNRCSQILDELKDLEIDQREQIQEEKKEFQLIQEQVDEVANLMSLPLSTTIANQS